MSVLSARVKVATLTISGTELIAIFGTPLTIVPAPGAGKIAVPITAHCRLQRGTTAYSASENLTIKWSGIATNLIQSVTILLANGPGGVLDQFFNAARLSTLTLTAGVDPSNRAIQVSLQNDVNAGSASDTLKVVLLYEEVPSLY